MTNLLHLISAILFIFALRGLSSAATAQKGNWFGIVGILIAIIPSIIAIFCNASLPAAFVIAFGSLIGFFIAKKINMTDLPQLLAAFHSLVGLSAVFIACAIFTDPNLFSIPLTNNLIPVSNSVEMILGTIVGAITFVGSVIAFAKLQGIVSGKPLRFKGQNKLNLIIAIVIVALIPLFTTYQSGALFVLILALSLLIGYLLIMPIGGADMPVIISMLNSYSGWAAVGIGFTLEKNILIIVGALVGTSGAILSNIMCKGMNRSLFKVIFGGEISSSVQGPASDSAGRNVKLSAPEDAAFIINNAESVIIVPGYGMAVAQAQHVIKELADLLKSNGISVKYAIHPVAGRMPGHMNVLLAEANIPYEDVFERDEINHEFPSTDVVIVIGANDITNPAARTDPTSPIYGMPVLDVDKARNVFFIKRSLASGYAGIDNSLFYQPNTMMVLGDAKKVCENLLKALKNLH